MPYDPLLVGSAGNDHTGDPARDGAQKLNAMLAEAPLGVSIKAGEALTAGDPVWLTVAAGVAVMLKANATGVTKPADGFVLADVSSAAMGVFQPLGAPYDVAASGFTIGTRYWLAVGGGVTATKPTTSGNGQQAIGVAITSTRLITYRAPMATAP